MAESAKVKKRYANSPKIGPKANGSTGAVTTTGATDATPGAAPAADPMAGTDGIPVHERQGIERQAMVDLHAGEMKDMHKRHATSLADMAARHLGELGMTPGKKD